MMAESTAKTMLVEISQGHLECPICFCRYKEPKILDCLHTFCLGCLNGMLSEQQPEVDKIACPVCRKETPVPDAGLPGLLDCFFLSSLVDEFSKQEQSLETQQQATTAPTCECEEGLVAVSRCLDCEGNLCQLCKTAQECSKRTKGHRFTPVQQHEQQEVPLTDHDKKYSPKCQKHGNQEMHFYCETCKMLACGTCAATDHRSTDHKYSEINDAVRCYRKEVNDVLEKFQKNKEEFKANEESVDDTRNSLKIMVTKACSKIQAKEEEEIAKIKTKAQVLRDKVTEIGENRDKEFEKLQTNNKNKMEQAEKIVGAVTDLMHQADDFEFLNLKPKVMQNLEFQKDLQFEKVKPGESFIDFRSQNAVNKYNLGTILTDTWKLKTSFGKSGRYQGEIKYITSIGCFSDGDIAVYDRENLRVTVFSPTGKCQTESNVNASLGIAVTSDDQLLVHCKDHVQLWNKSCRPILQFKLPQSKTTEDLIFTCGVAVDNNNQVAVLDVTRGVISLHKVHGSLIKIIPTAKLIPTDFAVNNEGCLVFAIYDKCELCCVDLTGKEMFNVRTTSVDGKLANPAGVCCDAVGDIYVTLHFNGNRKGYGEVHHYDSKGTYVDCVAKELCYPYGITFSPSGELVVADWRSVKIFEKV